MTEGGSGEGPDLPSVSLHMVPRVQAGPDKRCFGPTSGAQCQLRAFSPQEDPQPCCLHATG